MSQPNGAETHRYRVIYPESVRTVLKTLGARADELGLRAEFISALKALDQRLRVEPLNLGEPLRDLPCAGLEERLGGHSFLLVRYAVDRIHYLVYVVHCQAVGHGF